MRRTAEADPLFLQADMVKLASYGFSSPMQCRAASDRCGACTVSSDSPGVGQQRGCSVSFPKRTAGRGRVPTTSFGFPGFSWAWAKWLMGPGPSHNS
ncbi:hypothetical protein Dimus_000673, partial [Dionaea muscipula]